jgi:hypothetical protein
MSKKSKTKQGWYKRLLYKISSFFSTEQQCRQPDYPRKALFEVRPNVSAESFQQVAKSRIQLLQLLGCQVQVVPLTTQIPIEYAGLLSYWNGGKLEYQEYLLIQSEFVEKKTLVSRRIGSSILPVVWPDPNNTVHSYHYNFDFSDAKVVIFS